MQHAKKNNERRKTQPAKPKNIFLREQRKLLTRLSAVINRPETSCFQDLGRFETLGSNLRYGIPKEVATVPITQGKSQKGLCLQVERSLSAPCILSYSASSIKLLKTSSIISHSAVASSGIGWRSPSVPFSFSV